jgi:hypothetical protein
MTFPAPFVWLLLVLALAIGWVLGALTSPQGRKWHKRFREREVIITKYKREMEKALVKARDRIRQLEEDREGGRTPPPDA